MVLAVVIQAASVQDRDGEMDVIDKLFETWNSIIKIFADNGYRGALIEKVKIKFKIAFEVIKRTESHTFKILPKRWIVERTFAWIDTNRRAAKNYERFKCRHNTFIRYKNNVEPFLKQLLSCSIKINTLMQLPLYPK